MNIKLNFAAVALLALAVSSQAFAQDNASQPPASTAPSAQQQNQDQHKKAAYVPGAKEATTQSTGDLIPYAVAIGVVVLIAVASSGGGHKSGNTGTN